MIIEPGSKKLKELVTEFWSMRLRYPFAPPKVKIYSREEYIEETGNEEFGYENNPYEVEAKKLEKEWWPEFEQLLKKRLEASGIG